jgi:hypothetical protein
MDSSIVTLANEGMIRLTDNLIHSIRKTGMKNRIYVLCLGKEALLYYEKDERVVALDIENLHSPEGGNRYANYGTQNFQNIILHKYPGIKQVMKETNDDVIFIDGDICILKNFNSYFENFKELNSEVLCSSNPDGDFCTGLTYFIHCDGAISFIDQHIALLKNKTLATEYFDDQTVFNELANSAACTTKITRLPENQFCNGYYLIAKGKKIGTLSNRIIDGEMYSVHANWIVGIEKKIYFLRKLGVYFVGNNIDLLRNLVMSRLIGLKRGVIKIYHHLVGAINI